MEQRAAFLQAFYVDRALGLPPSPEWLEIQTRPDRRLRALLQGRLPSGPMVDDQIRLFFRNKGENKEPAPVAVYAWWINQNRTPVLIADIEDSIALRSVRLYGHLYVQSEILPLLDRELGQMGRLGTDEIRGVLQRHGLYLLRRGYLLQLAESNETFARVATFACESDFYRAFGDWWTAQNAANDGVLPRVVARDPPRDAAPAATSSRRRSKPKPKSKPRGTAGPRKRSGARRGRPRV